MSAHEFGGGWTGEKLERVRKYLVAYTTLMTANERARFFQTIYVDAFAGTGYRSLKRIGSASNPELVPDPDRTAFLKGSARIALDVEPPFHQYVFVEKNTERFRQLEQLKTEFPARAHRITIVNQDATDYLKQWSRQLDWRRWRAVVFLDPYGMQVDWALIEALAETRAVDLWILFPLGQAVNRLLTKHEPPPEDWADQLTRMFGTNMWRQEFYPKQVQQTLFGEQESYAKDTDFERIGKFFVKRLKTVFAGVAENPLPLRNSKNIPLFLLCFASANPRGATTAIKIAQNILGT
jgi:three-Cys-motif partner protein